MQEARSTLRTAIEQAKRHIPDAGKMVGPCKYPKCPYPCPDLPDCKDAEKQQAPAAVVNQQLTTEVAAPVQEPVALDVTLDGEEAKLLRDMLGDDRDELSPVRLLVGNGHSGHGLYAAHAEYQEEGAVLLAATPPAAPVQELDGIEWLKKDGGYFAPPAAQRQWQGLTDKDVTASQPYSITRDKGCFHAGAKWADAKLREKNGG